MPYKMFKQDNKWCVKNEDTGENKGCSDSRAKAVGHMRALYAAEGGAKMGKKELDELVIKAIEDYNTENPDDLITKEETENVEKGYAPSGVYSFATLREYRAAQELTEATAELSSDFSSLVWNVLYSSEITDKPAAIKSLADEFASIMDEELTQAVDESKELDEKAAKREDVSPADKKRAVEEYGNVTYADPTNKKYPIDTEEHIRAAWSYINMPKNQKKYSSGQVAAIKGKIVAAWKKKIDKNGPPKASTKERILNFFDVTKERFSDFLDANVTGLEDDEPEESDILIWKEADTGQYRWFGRYSNNFRDVDNPPEIISESSHKLFVDKVEKGLAPYPELWLWHIPEYKIGQADWLAYDDAGFALASGTFDKGLDDVAEWLMEQKSVLMSHGMPPWSLKYDTSDPSVIVEHESREISPLPYFAAANKLTGFAVLGNGKEEDMAIPKEKKDFLIKNWGADPAMLERLEAMNAKVAEVAKEAGLESKEATTEEVATETVKTEEVTTEAVSTETIPTTDYPTRQEIVTAVAAVLTPVVDRLEKLEADFGGLAKEISGLKTTEDEKVKQVIDSTPVASLGALLASRVIGNDYARVDGRTKLADSKPKEAPAERVIGVPFLDTMISGKTE